MRCSWLVIYVIFQVYKYGTLTMFKGYSFCIYSWLYSPLLYNIPLQLLYFTQQFEFLILYPGLAPSRLPHPTGNCQFVLHSESVKITDEAVCVFLDCCILVCCIFVVCLYIVYTIYNNIYIIYTIQYLYIVYLLYICILLYIQFVVFFRFQV